MKIKILFLSNLIFSCLVGCNNIIEPNSDSIKLSTLYSWIDEINVDDIKLVTSKIDVGTIQPSFFDAYNIHYKAKDNEEISTLLTKIKDLTVKKEKDPLWSGGESYSLTFQLNNGNGYTLTSYYNGFSINDNYYVYNDNGLPSCSTFYGRQFVWYSIDNFKLYYNDEEVTEVSNKMCQNFLYDIRYKVNESKEVNQDVNYKGYVLKSSNGFQIEIISNKSFRVIKNDIDEICTIESEKGFSNLING